MIKDLDRSKIFSLKSQSNTLYVMNVEPIDPTV